mgnify:CR=1 FL=1
MERLGREPDPAKAPLEKSHFPFEVQIAFFVHSLLPERWDGASGSYLGKKRWKNSVNKMKDAQAGVNQKFPIYLEKNNGKE